MDEVSSGIACGECGVARGSKARGAILLRRALHGLLLVAALAVLNIGSLSVARADCNDGYGECSDGLCYPLGAQCCQGGGACPAGNNCWGTSNGTNFCCKDGDVGFVDGGCAPASTTANSYCGNGRYCENSEDTCWTVFVSSGTCCKLGDFPQPDGFCAPVPSGGPNYCGGGNYCPGAAQHCCNNNTSCCQ
jgi:hypothetical protein